MSTMEFINVLPPSMYIVKVFLLDKHVISCSLLVQSSLRRLQDEFKSQWDEINAKADEEAR